MQPSKLGTKKSTQIYKYSAQYICTKHTCYKHLLYLYSCRSWDQSAFSPTSSCWTNVNTNDKTSTNVQKIWSHEQDRGQKMAQARQVGYECHFPTAGSWAREKRGISSCFALKTLPVLTEGSMKPCQGHFIWLLSSTMKMTVVTTEVFNTPMVVTSWSRP